MVEARANGRPTRMKCPLEKKQHNRPNRAHTVYFSARPRGDLMWHLTARAAIAEQIPIRAFRVDLNAAPTFVLTVVPFEKIPINPRNHSEDR
jgi:hypothetical protein